MRQMWLYASSVADEAVSRIAGYSIARPLHLLQLLKTHWYLTLNTLLNTAQHLQGMPEDLGSMHAIWLLGTLRTSN